MTVSVGLDDPHHLNVWMQLGAQGGYIVSQCIEMDFRPGVSVKSLPECGCGFGELRNGLAP